MSQAQEIPAVAVAGIMASNTQAEEPKNKTKIKTKTKAKTLKNLMPSGPGFEMWRDAANEEVKILDDEGETIAFKNALRAISPNLDKGAVDSAFAELFIKAAEIAAHRPATDGIPDILLAAARKVSWVIAARKEMKPTIAAKVMMRFYDARRIAIKFSRYRQHPVAYDDETATAKAIDKLRNEKPLDKPEELFADFTQAQLDEMMGKIRRRERADWNGEVDQDGDTNMMNEEETVEFIKAQKAAMAELEEAIEQKMKEMGIQGNAGFLG